MKNENLPGVLVTGAVPPFLLSETYQIEQYNQTVIAYQQEAFTLTDEQIDKLVFQVGSGHASYADFKKAVPELNSSTLSQYLSDDPKPPDGMPDRFRAFDAVVLHRNPYYFKLETIPKKFVYPYTFKSMDRFALTVSGQNRLYALKKELRLLDLAKQSASSAETSNKYARLSYIATIVGIVIGVLGTLLSQLFPK